MDENKLNIILKYRNRWVKYSYKYGKKRRFYLQYMNSRNINKLFDFLSHELIRDNTEWCHCFEIIKGKNIFNEMSLENYNQINDIIDKI